MKLEYISTELTQKQREDKMKNSRPLNYPWLINKILKELPKLYKNLCLDFYNPYYLKSCETKKHYILVHSGIEYFILK